MENVRDGRHTARLFLLKAVLFFFCGGAFATAEPDCPMPELTDHFETVKCILKLACTTCSSDLKKDDVRYGLSGILVDRISLPKSRTAKFGQFQIDGAFSIHIMQGQYGTSVCPSEQAKAFINNIPLIGCFDLHLGRPM